MFFAGEAAACASGARCVTVAPRTATETGACATGSRCIQVPQREPEPAPFDIGAPLEPGTYSILANIDRYDLDRPRDGWAYVVIEDWVLRVDLNSREVLEDVTAKMPHWFYR